MNEIWKDIPGFEGKYRASSMGRIKSLDRLVRSKCHYTGQDFYRKMQGRILKPGRFCKCGHVSVILEHGGVGRPVHQLIALTFLEPCPNGCEVLHENGIPTDNRVCNLRYGTRTENILYVYKDGGRWRKLSTDDVESIRFGLSCDIAGVELASMYGVSASTISHVKVGRSFRWLK